MDLGIHRHHAAEEDGGCPDRGDMGSGLLVPCRPRGERGVLVVPLDALVRISSNPFYPYIERQVSEGIERLPGRLRDGRSDRSKSGLSTEFRSLRTTCPGRTWSTAGAARLPSCRRTIVLPGSSRQEAFGDHWSKLPNSHPLQFTRAERSCGDVPKNDSVPESANGRSASQGQVERGIQHGEGRESEAGVGPAAHDGGNSAHR
jgi:hypothetical protein